jgi:aspartate kinase
MAALFVQKYGGTSVAEPERIHRVAERIALRFRQGHRLAVVVSAMGHTTDELIELAHRVSKSPPQREMDMLLTAGERISMALLSMALWDRGVPAVSFTGSQSGIITDGTHRRARIKKILGDRVRDALAQGQVAIVAGFQGVSEEREITTLGRGGSDTTAVALAAVLKAQVCEIYTDVDGVFSADPRTVRSARLQRRIPHDLMVELATRGAGVLHPRSVELAKQYSVPLRVINSLGKDLSSIRGTEVVMRGMEEFGVIGVTSDSGKAWLDVRLSRPTALSALWDVATRNHLAVVAAQFMDGRVSCFVERDCEGEWRTQLQRLATEGFVSAYEWRGDWVPISVVGDRFSQDGTALQQVLEALASAGVEATAGHASSLAITVAVPVARAQEAVQHLHQVFIERSSS